MYQSINCIKKYLSEPKGTSIEFFNPNEIEVEEFPAITVCNQAFNFDKSKQLYLFSHHPKGLVWQVSTKLSTTPMRGVLKGVDSEDSDASVDESAESCPDNDFIKWEWFNSTTSQGQQLYVKDEHIQVKCIS